MYFAIYLTWLGYVDGILHSWETNHLFGTVTLVELNWKNQRSDSGVGRNRKSKYNQSKSGVGSDYSYQSTHGLIIAFLFSLISNDLLFAASQMRGIISLMPSGFFCCWSVKKSNSKTEQTSSVRIVPVGGDSRVWITISNLLSDSNRSDVGLVEGRGIIKNVNVIFLKLATCRYIHEM